MKRETLNILIGGEAGQGLLTIGKLLSKSLIRSGFFVVVTQSYQSRIRGGHNTLAIRVSAHEITAPQESVDLLVALSAETASLHRQDLSPEGLIVADTAFDHLPDEACLKVPYKELSKGRYSNIVALGVIGALLGLKESIIADLLEQNFRKKEPEVSDQNLRVLRTAFEWCTERETPFQPLPCITHPEKRLMMEGNEAIALGALAAGVRFCAFYPMTPSTSISMNLAARAKEMGLVVEQGEDEIAVINMALGASYAGAPSMVATSGGGFALMVEGVSLAAMTETPLVIVVGQRPGPATGLPTRTEQGDLEFVLHSGHGEFPRAVFAPSTPEECFYLTHRAFELAERYQGPVFILTDQLLADSYRSVAPFDLETIDQVPVAADHEAVQKPYRRYTLTESGVSARLLPGRSEHLVVADSDEHDEEGHITEDLWIRKQMVQKRLKKYNGLCKKVVAPAYEGDNRPDLLLVSWGSTQGSVQEAAIRLREKGTQAATLHFSQLWPMLPDSFLRHLKDAREVVLVEGNATGQLARLIRAESGFEIKKRILRYDGLPITPEFILRDLDRTSL